MEKTGEFPETPPPNPGVCVLTVCAGVCLGVCVSVHASVHIHRKIEVRACVYIEKVRARVKESEGERERKREPPPPLPVCV